MSDNNDFILVKSKRRKNKFSNARAKLKITEDQLQYNRTTFDSDYIVRRIHSFTDDITQSEFYKSTISELTKFDIKKVICLGLGSFSSCLSATNQLAFIVAVINQFGVKDSVFYDPCFTEQEVKILEDFGFQISSENISAKYKVSEDITTLAYFPHCPHELINSFLWKNWSKNLCNIVYIGNSFEHLLTNSIEVVVEKNLHYISKISKYTEEIQFENTFKYIEVFHIQTIHVFPLKNISQLNDSFWSNLIEPENIADTFEKLNI